MIQSTGDSAIVEYVCKKGKNEITGVKIVHCKEGEELNIIRAMDRNLKNAEIVGIKRVKSTLKSTLQKNINSIIIQS